MSERFRAVLAYLAALVLALATATALDAFGMGWMQSHAQLVGVAIAVGAVQGFLWPRLLLKQRSYGAAFVGAVAAGTLVFVLARSTLPWLDLGPIGAGPPGELPLVVLPLSSLLAVAATFRPRGASPR